VHISKLRRKLDPDGDQPMIHTVRGSGYLLRAPD
jgi:two-component system, OmpR family, response regulator